MSKKIFPDVPEDLTGASEDDVRALLGDIEALLLKVKDRDEETLGDLTIAEAYEQAKVAVAARGALKAHLDSLGELDATFEAEMAKMTEDIAVVEAAEEVVAEAEAATAEAAVEEPVVEETVAEQEPVLASATQRAAKPRPPQPSAQFAPPADTEPEAPRPALVASTGIPGIMPGEILDGDQLVRAFTEAAGVKSATSREKVVVARADFRNFFPDERKLTEGLTASAANRIIQEVVGDRALTASGGLCAPVTPYYNLMTVATAARPVRDSLAVFNAVRGGLQFGRPLNLADVAGGVGIKTESEDAAGGTFATKDCLFVECPTFETSYLNMIYRCLQFGNLNSRAFPEMVSQAIELAVAYHARVADSALLDYIGDSSTAVTQAQLYGATSTLIDSLLFAAAGMRSRNRMSIDSRFRVLLPAWARELMSADTVNSQFYRGQVEPGNADALLRAYGVEPTWYLDTETGAGQIFGTQSAGALLDFPTTVVAYIFPEGSYLFLDGGTLDLGVVRDSTLNSTNDFEVFAETFEAAAYIGVESLKITATVCPDGSTGGPDTLITC